jgi:hypothetical protein
MRMLPSATQPLPASGPSVVTPAPMLDAGTSASLVPSDVRAVVSGVHHGRHDRTAFPDTACPVDPAGHRPLHPARHGEGGSDADRERTNGTEGVRTSSIATTTAATRQLLGVALASKPRLGALLSSDQMGGE